MGRKLSRKGLEKKILERWSERVKQNALFKCEVCGVSGFYCTLNSHHIIGRRNQRLRYDVRNGVCLCATHHTLGTESAHQSPVWFTRWLEQRRGKDLDYIESVQHQIKKWTLKELEELLETM